MGYFSAGKYSALDNLIEEDLVATNEVILSELIPYLNNIGNKKAIFALEGVHFKKLSIERSIIRKMQSMNLKMALIELACLI